MTLGIVWLRSSAAWSSKKSSRWSTSREARWKLLSTGLCYPYPTKSIVFNSLRLSRRVLPRFKCRWGSQSWHSGTITWPGVCISGLTSALKLFPHMSAACCTKHQKLQTLCSPLSSLSWLGKWHHQAYSEFTLKERFWSSSPLSFWFHQFANES